MLFNSIEFFGFFLIFFYLYWFVFKNNLNYQNLLILIGSYIFYSFWDYRFLSLIFFSTVIDYFCGNKINLTKRVRNKRVYLAISLITNLGILGTFKYFNFFISEFNNLLNLFIKAEVNTWSLNIILPVGISFYTFQTLSYTIDIYKNKLKPTQDFISFASFVAFFPQLVAGPIERATKLLPQILNDRKFNYNQSISGLKLVVWGLFKKIVIADNLAHAVDPIFAEYSTFNGGVLFLGAIFFSFQIYCDFSGYSDIAIGISKLLGFELMSNFKFPYFSKNITQFWNRWHISLSTWFRDYLYFPLGGSKKTRFIKIRNVAIVFLISGLWHGSNWTFVFWGFIHLLIYMFSMIFDKTTFLSENLEQNKWIIYFKVSMTFISVTIAWIFFRSESIEIAFNYILLMITNFDFPNISRSYIILVMIFVLLENLIKRDERELLFFKNSILNIIVFYFLYLSIISNSVNLTDFIYFKF